MSKFEKCVILKRKTFVVAADHSNLVRDWSAGGGHPLPLCEAARLKRGYPDRTIERGVFTHLIRGGRGGNVFIAVQGEVLFPLILILNDSSNPSANRRGPNLNHAT